MNMLIQKKNGLELKVAFRYDFCFSEYYRDEARPSAVQGSWTPN